MTEYAVKSRYPGVYYPIDSEDFQEAIEIAIEVFMWAENIINLTNQK